MITKKTYFMGLLANVDSSILKVTLDYGFKIEAISEDEGIDIISDFKRLPNMEVEKKLSDIQCVNYAEKKLYFISNAFESENLFSSELEHFQSNSVRNYLNPKIRLMRLFKEGNICIPSKYYFFIENSTSKQFFSERAPLYISEELYTLDSQEIADLQRFIQNTDLPFKEPSLQLAFENFELSYQVDNINQSFLSLMISLETLFIPGRQKLRYSVSRNTAVLLGKDKEDSKMIFREIKELYDKRSKVAHTGKNSINEEDLLKLRNYARVSIKAIYKTGKCKEELLGILNSSEFGERPLDKMNNISVS